MTRAIRLFRAFSLVELLVVMAIVAILAGLAFPTLAAMRERGRRVKCMNNIRQIALAMHTYASDHDGFFYSPTNNYTAIVATPMYYSGVFWTGSSWAGPMHLWEGMSNYIKNTEVLYCPTALQKKLQYSGGGGYFPEFQFGKVMPWGSLLGSDTNYGMMAYMDDTADSSTIMLFENPVSYGHAYFYATAGQGNQWELDIRNGSTYYLSGVIHYASAYWTDSAPMVHDFPYIDPGAHVAYVDGRVEWQKGPRIKYIRRYPMKHVPGWLWWRDSDDAGIYGIW